MYHISMMMNVLDISLGNRPTRSPFALSVVEGPVLGRVEGPKSPPQTTPSKMSQCDIPPRYENVTNVTILWNL